MSTSPILVDPLELQKKTPPPGAPQPGGKTPTGGLVVDPLEMQKPPVPAAGTAGPPALPNQPSAQPAPDQEAIKRKYGLAKEFDLSKPFFDPVNLKASDPSRNLQNMQAFGSAAQEFNPPKPRPKGFFRNIWEEVKAIASGVTQEPADPSFATEVPGPGFFSLGRPVDIARPMVHAAKAAAAGQFKEAGKAAVESVPIVGPQILARAEQAKTDPWGAAGAGVVDALALESMRRGIGKELEGEVPREASAIGKPEVEPMAQPKPATGRAVASPETVESLAEVQRLQGLLDSGKAKPEEKAILQRQLAFATEQFNKVTPESLGGKAVTVEPQQVEPVGPEKAPSEAGAPTPPLAPERPAERMGTQEKAPIEVAAKPKAEPLHAEIKTLEKRMMDQQAQAGRARAWPRANKLIQQARKVSEQIQELKKQAGPSTPAQPAEVAESKPAPSAVPLAHTEKTIPNPHENYTPAEIKEAEELISGTAGQLSAFDRPGRYFSEAGDASGFDVLSGKEKTHLGTWYGVKSQKPNTPWLKDTEFTPGQLETALAKGKGALYNRILDSAAEYVRRQHFNESPEGKAAAEERSRGILSLASTQRPNRFVPGPETLPTTPKLEGVLPGMETAVTEQKAAAAAHQGEELTKEIARPLSNIDRAAGEMEAKSPLFRGSGASPQEEMFGEKPAVEGKAAAAPLSNREEANRMREPGEEGPEGTLFANPVGPVLQMAKRGADVLARAWDEKIAQPLINAITGGEKYAEARKADPAVAEAMHLLDNAPSYLRAKAEQNVKNVVGTLSRAQERLFVLLADADSRRNLELNHRAEYEQAIADPEIQAALERYKPLEQELTAARERLGGAILDDDYLRRVYEKHTSGIGKRAVPGEGKAVTGYDRVIRPQKPDRYSREATAEYHYQNGLHEFGPAYGTKFVATRLKLARDEVAREFMSSATSLSRGEGEPREINYRGDTYYRPDIAADMRLAGKTGVKEYGRYDPEAGKRTVLIDKEEGKSFPIRNSQEFLGPKELVKEMNDFGRRDDTEPGGLRRFLREQIIAWGMGSVHIANIMRRVSQSVEGAALNPKGWAEAWKVAFGKELRERGISGLNDPTIDKLAQRGAVSTAEMQNLKAYWGGNLNPANWATWLAQKGHDVLFKPGSMGGFGGVDQRARIWLADFIKSRKPEMSDTEIAAAVREQLGDYSRTNWTDRQKLIGKFMMFPGWDVSSLKWVIRHPVKTSVPPAVLVLLANQVLHQQGKNRDSDQWDITNLHVGDRAYGLSVLREPLARTVLAPALAYAQSKIKGETGGRPFNEAVKGIERIPAGSMSQMMPQYSGFAALAFNKQSPLRGGDLIAKDDWTTPGKVLPSKAAEKLAVFTVRHALPALDRMLSSDQDIDLLSFAGANAGLPNYPSDAKSHLLTNASKAYEARSAVARLAKTDPEAARRFLHDPDNATYALFQQDFATLTGALKQLDELEQRAGKNPANAAEEQRRKDSIKQRRQKILREADGFDRLLFNRLGSARLRALAAGRVSPGPPREAHPVQ